MTTLRWIAIAVLLVIAASAVGATWLLPDDTTQNREFIQQPPSKQFPLGTDQLGRDNLSRLLSGLRVSMLLATAAAAGSCMLALLFGAVSGFTGGWLEVLLLSTISIVESVPWLFLFLSVRALLPLNVAPAASLQVTFAMLAILGWTHAARVFQAAAQQFRTSDAILYARACGVAGWRLWFRQALPALRNVTFTQFTLLIPTFILAEAGLGLLGLGVAEPMASLGNLLRQLENRELLASQPVVLAPVAVLVVVMICFRTACGDLELTS